jgi:hypothetical protein
MRSRIEPMKKIARSLREHRELILNYFRAQKSLSSGVVEGLNNKAKVTMRKSYGFRTFRCLELALYHSLGKLPEPEVFCPLCGELRLQGLHADAHVYSPLPEVMESLLQGESGVVVSAGIKQPQVHRVCS